jgi:hypothetical protein
MVNWINEPKKVKKLLRDWKKQERPGKRPPRKSVFGSGEIFLLNLKGIEYEK